MRSAIVRSLLGLALGGSAAMAEAQGNGAPVPVPWEVGEAFTYDVKFGVIKVGTGRMRVLGRDTIRGRDTWHIRFGVSGGTFFYKVNDKYESWMDVQTLNSLQYIQDLQQGSRDRERTFEMFPERATYREIERGGKERESVSNPLDDGSFLYFVRTVPLVVGESYSFHRYFKPDRNPVIIRVLRKERVKVPAGTFDAIVVQPIIKTSGIFSEGGQAEIWLSDDDKRMMLQMKSRLSFGSLNLYLRAHRFSAPPAEAAVEPVDSVPSRP